MSHCPFVSVSVSDICLFFLLFNSIAFRPLLQQPDSLQRIDHPRLFTEVVKVIEKSLNGGRKLYKRLLIGRNPLSRDLLKHSHWSKRRAKGPFHGGGGL